MIILTSRKYKIVMFNYLKSYLLVKINKYIYKPYNIYLILSDKIIKFNNDLLDTTFTKAVLFRCPATLIATHMYSPELCWVNEEMRNLRKKSI